MPGEGQAVTLMRLRQLRMRVLYQIHACVTLARQKEKPGDGQAVRLMRLRRVRVCSLDTFCQMCVCFLSWLIQVCIEFHACLTLARPDERPGEGQAAMLLRLRRLRMSVLSGYMLPNLCASCRG